MKKYIFTPFMKWFLSGLGLILIIQYIILPGLTAPNTIMNIIVLIVAAVLANILGRIIIESIKNKLKTKS